MYSVGQGRTKHVLKSTYPNAERFIFPPVRCSSANNPVRVLPPLNATLHTLGYIHTCSLFDRTHPKVIQLVFPPSLTPPPSFFFSRLASLLGCSG